MIQLIVNNIKEIKRICAKYKGKSLSLTGSAFSGIWDPHTSNNDYIIEFEPMNPEDHANFSFSLNEDLESLPGYPVNLIEMAAVSHLYLRESCTSSQEPLYAIT